MKLTFIFLIAPFLISNGCDRNDDLGETGEQPLERQEEYRQKDFRDAGEDNINNIDIDRTILQDNEETDN